MIEQIVMEEVSQLNESRFWRGVGSLALKAGKAAALTAISPATMGDRVVRKAFNTVTGKEPLFNLNGTSARNGSQTKTSTTGKTYYNSSNIYSIRHEFGTPETVAGMGKKLEKPQEMREQNFLGTGLDVKFGKHYLELDQTKENSVWSKKLKEAQEGLENARNQDKIRKYTKQYVDVLKDWLNERDRAYENYVKIMNGKMN